MSAMKNAKQGATALFLIACWFAPVFAHAAESNDGPIHHVVIAWLKKHGDEADRKKVLEACKGLEAIPGVVSVVGGAVLPSKRSVVDSSFDIGLVITVEDNKALSSYVKHPIHQKVLKETLKPLLERYVVYDLNAAP